MHSTSSEAMVSNSIQTRHAIVPTVGPQKGVLLLTANPLHPDVRPAVRQSARALKHPHSG